MNKTHAQFYICNSLEENNIKLYKEDRCAIINFLEKNEEWDEDFLHKCVKTFLKRRKQFKKDIKTIKSIQVQHPFELEWYKDTTKYNNHKAGAANGAAEGLIRFYTDWQWANIAGCDLYDPNTDKFYELKGINSKTKETKQTKRRKNMKGKEIENTSSFHVEVIKRKKNSKRGTVIEKDCEPDIIKVKIPLYQKPSKYAKPIPVDINKLYYIYTKNVGNEIKISIKSAKAVLNYFNNIFLKTPYTDVITGETFPYNVYKITNYNHGIRMTFEEFDAIEEID